jgi:hypothetical protein
MRLPNATRFGDSVVASHLTPPPTTIRTGHLDLWDISIYGLIETYWYHEGHRFTTGATSMHWTRSIRTLGLVVAFTAATAMPALAGSYSLSFSGSGISASDLDLTATETGPSTGVYLVSSASGTIDILGVPYSASLIPPVGAIGNDNLLFYPPTTTGYFDTGGIALLAQGPGNSGAWIQIAWWPTVLSPWVQVSAWIVFTGGSPTIAQEPLTSISVSSIPEPSPTILLAIGTTFAAFSLRRRKSAPHPSS